MSIQLQDFGSFYVGGRAVEIHDQPAHLVNMSNQITGFSANPNGTFLVEQAYVQYFIPVRLRFETPVLLVHGGGLSGTTWETTPDGRPGWLQLLLEAGIATYVIDNVERGRAGWCSLPGIWSGEPLLRSEPEAWTVYKLGDPLTREPFAGQRFPMASVDMLMRYTVPRWTTTSEAAQAALEAAIRRIGPCIVIGHSQGGGLAVRAALQLPDLVKAVVALEPHGLPESLTDRGVENRMLFVLADFNDKTHIYAQLAARVRQIVREWPHTELLDLPAAGIFGNSHMMMMDSNGADVLYLIIAWLDHILKKGTKKAEYQPWYSAMMR